MGRYTLTCFLLCLVLVLGMTFTLSAHQAIPGEEEFIAVVLGSGGGPREDDVSGFMVWPGGKPEEAIFFDPGVLTVGIRKADEMGNLWDFQVPPEEDMTREGFILQNARAYLISHAHLDHISAMVINSPDDSPKAIMGTPTTLKNLQEHVFNWKIWPNFGDAGPEPHLGQYSYIELVDDTASSIPETSMTVEALELAHDYPGTSTAFLVEHQGNYILLCGDTGPDEVEGTDHLYRLWQRITPLIQEGSLRGIFLEISYTSDRPDDLLFGHLTPHWMMVELRRLAEMVDPDNPEDALEGLRVVVTHIKPKFVHSPSTRHTVEKELLQLNDLGIHFIIPYQGHRLEF